MRIAVLILVLTVTSGSRMCSRAKPNAASPTGPTVSTRSQASSAAVPTTVEFATQVRPILEPRCQPCHFEGGKMYQRLPFDRPETIRALGTKLFSRIKDEHERQLIGAFLSQQSELGRAHP